ncbi:hypothetical protein ACCY16_02015 [Candidatus Pantoea formicae]|uniref:hypothetical protein n=1 Tax=Candidatus Pantoea formicae TaxID=2608355 RepID=UPI003EDB518F
MNKKSGKNGLTLREFVRRKTGIFTARDVLNEYREYRNEIRLDVVRRQLELMAGESYLMRHKHGVNVSYSVRASKCSMVREFDALISAVRTGDAP